MLDWSINLFRIRGIKLELHGSFLLLLAYTAWDGWQEQAGAGLVWGTATLLAFFGCVVLHELGHSFTAIRYGIGVRRILLMPIGGMAEFDSIPRQPSREILMTLAGPGVNFALAAMLWFSVRHLPDEVELYSASGLVYRMFVANLVMGIFNLLPAFPMDGGRILRALLALRLPYLRATYFAATVGKIIAGLGIIAALAAPELHLASERLWLVAVLFMFISFAGETEYRAVKRREFEDAHWRETLARLYRHTLTEEPPVLPPQS